MKKTLLLGKLLILAVAFNVNAQIDFEGLLHNYWDGSDLTGGINSNNYHFVNYYNTTYSSWSGFAYSKMTDTLTSGYLNQYSAITGEGHNSSPNYLTSFISTWDGTDYLKLDTATNLKGFYVTNSTYVYLSIRDGDSFVKKFGGINGNDPDWLILTIKGFNAGVFSDSVNFYLADYRDSINTNDYIIKNWSFVDLSSLNIIDSVTFEMSSTDTGAFGMNTPAYFCMDDLTDVNNAVTNFEEFDFDYWNGADLSGGFNSGEVFLYNTYDTSWNSWTGFAYSRKADTTTSGYTNQYSAITGKAHDTSEIYVVGNGNPSMTFDKSYTINSLFITNSTYVYLSLLNGDAFVKKFGGVSGNDPDWFLLTIKGFNKGVYYDSVNFYLADYRFTNNNDDYIINKWTEVDLSSLGNVDSLTFELSSTDNGMFGMNTPAYFCMDYITFLKNSVNFEPITKRNIEIYPNPVENILNITNVNNSDITIYNLSGKLVYFEKANQNNLQMNLTTLKSGLYIISIKNKTENVNYKLIKY